MRPTDEELRALLELEAKHLGIFMSVAREEFRAIVTELLERRRCVVCQPTQGPICEQCWKELSGK